MAGVQSCNDATSLSNLPISLLTNLVKNPKRSNFKFYFYIYDLNLLDHKYKDWKSYFFLDYLVIYSKLEYIYRKF